MDEDAVWFEIYTLENRLCGLLIVMHSFFSFPLKQYLSHQSGDLHAAVCVTCDCNAHSSVILSGSGISYK